MTFHYPVSATKLRIHETFGAGSMSKLEARDTAGNHHTLWSGTDSAPCPGWLEIDIPKASYLVAGVKIHTAHPDEERIDAVELIGDLP